MDTVTFSMPPLPVFIKGAESVFSAGKRHVRRTFSVFDLLYHPEPRRPPLPRVSVSGG